MEQFEWSNFQLIMIFKQDNDLKLCFKKINKGEMHRSAQSLDPNFIEHL